LGLFYDKELDTSNRNNKIYSYIIAGERQKQKSECSMNKQTRKYENATYNE
jgi:hypothetical protein